MLRHVMGQRWLRNVGIISHIDAGKTTTTEAMLHFSGLSHVLGAVDDGNTVTDYLDEERERGITIQSACVTLPWKEDHINLVDTPGHVDFTFEVERSLRVVDGAVLLIDGVSGVQAQTEMVWRQSINHNIPSMVFINKLDREGSSYDRSLASLRIKLPDRVFIPIQLPMYGKNARGVTVFTGVIDLLKDDCPDIVEGRNELIEALAELDDQMMEGFVNEETFTASQLKAAIRRVLITRMHQGKTDVIPVLCGAALGRLGVPELMDAILDYLPGPLDTPKSEASIVTRPLCPDRIVEKLTGSKDSQLCCLAFKVIVDAQRGPIVFVRVFSGVLTPRSVLYVSRPVICPDTGAPKDEFVRERISKLLQLRGESWDEVEEVGPGGIIAIMGSKHVRTGDTLSGLPPNVTRKYTKHPPIYKLAGIVSPSPVFFASIEPERSGELVKLKEALASIEKEDPSVVIDLDSATGQTLVKGMGELHLEIVHRRIRKHFGIQSFLGKMAVAYRETIQSAIDQYESIQSCIPGCEDLVVGLNLRIEPRSDAGSGDGNLFVVSESKKRSWLEDLKYGTLLERIEEGCLNACLRGSLTGNPMMRVKIELLDVDRKVVTSGQSVVVSKVTNDELVLFHSCAYRAVEHAIRKCSPVMMEPVMKVDIITPTDSTGAILTDLASKRRAMNIDIEQDEVGTIVHADVPLAEMVGYSRHLRSIAKGSAHYTLSFNNYQQLTSKGAPNSLP